MNRKYICDLRYDDNDETITMPAIAHQFPSLAWSLQSHHDNPLVPKGRVCILVNDVSTEMHGEIMQVPGVELFD